MKLPQLNLPPISNNLFRKSDSEIYIFDAIRKKELVLTPEEWVRQHYIHFLIENQYPKALIRIEGGTTSYQLKKRTDIVVYNREGHPFLLVECKAAHIQLDENVLMQLLTYNQSVKAPFIALTNGLNHLYGMVDFKTKKLRQLNELPEFT